MMGEKLNLNAADNLAPIRKQLAALVAPNSSVIEFGCGNGDLLFTLSPQIKSGLGIDKSENLIGHAIAQKKQMGFDHIDFVCEALGENFSHTKFYDFSIASLFFHVIPRPDSVYLLRKMREISDQILICGFSAPDSLRQKIFMWLDQRFSGHYQNFRAYQKSGYLKGLLVEVPLANVEAYDTYIPFVKIYKIN